MFSKIKKVLNVFFDKLEKKLFNICWIILLINYEKICRT
jgi:hypothetical protein